MLTRDSFKEGSIDNKDKDIFDPWLAQGRIKKNLYCPFIVQGRGHLSATPKFPSAPPKFPYRHTQMSQKLGVALS